MHMRFLPGDPCVGRFLHSSLLQTAKGLALTLSVLGVASSLVGAARAQSPESSPAAVVSNASAPAAAAALPAAPNPTASAIQPRAANAAASAASPKTTTAPSPARSLSAPNWQALSPAQRAALAPLAKDWNALDDTRKSKWLEVAGRFPSLPPEEQSRMQERMHDWTRLSAAERQQARLGFQVAQQIKTGDRQAKWEAYKALPPERREQLAEQAKLRQKAQKSGAASSDANRPQSKSNLVPNPARMLPSKPVAPSLLQARPGASTVLISQAAAMPAHQRAGKTKIWADPSLVDGKTLLPKRAGRASDIEP